MSKDLRTFILGDTLSSAEITEIYEDIQYGMSNAKTLTYWVKAAISGSATSEASLILIDHFREEGLIITTDQMNLMIGSSSSMAGILFTGEFNKNGVYTSLVLGPSYIESDGG